MTSIINTKELKGSFCNSILALGQFGLMSNPYNNTLQATVSIYNIITYENKTKYNKHLFRSLKKRDLIR
jgi:hypothetical protein